jgi:thiamine transport system permease protein
VNGETVLPIESNSNFRIERSLEQKLAAAILIGLFLSPIFFLLISGVTPASPFRSEVLSVFGFTLLQAVMSAALAVTGGVIGAYGLAAAELKFGRMNGKLLGALAVLPNVAPVLLFLLAVMKFLPMLRGLPGIIVIHALLNIGLVSASVTRLFQEKVSPLADLALVEGSNRIRFFARVVWPTLKADLRTIFLFVFALCFSSLAVPLVIGGSRATTMEVLIWQNIRLEGNFSSALGIALLQVVAILVLTFLLRRKTTPQTPARSQVAQPLLANLWGLPVALFPSLLLLASMFDRPWIGAQRLFREEFLAQELVKNFFGSALVALATGVLVAAVLLKIAYVDPRGAWRRFLLGYVAPSSVITGFSLLLVWRAIGGATYFKIIFALTLITVPGFYRLYWDAALESLRDQRLVARSLGASVWLTYRKVVLPQLIAPACFIAGLASLWAWGDFAVSRVVAERDVTLAMTVQSLMASYRFEMATFLVWILLFGGAATFFIFEGAGRVLGKKSSR